MASSSLSVFQARISTGGHEQFPPADAGDEPGYGRVVIFGGQAHDDVVQPAQALAGRIDDGAAQQFGQLQGGVGLGSGRGAGHVDHDAPP